MWPCARLLPRTRELGARCCSPCSPGRDWPRVVDPARIRRRGARGRAGRRTVDARPGRWRRPLAARRRRRRRPTRRAIVLEALPAVLDAMAEAGLPGRSWQMRRSPRPRMTDAGSGASWRQRPRGTRRPAASSTAWLAARSESIRSIASCSTAGSRAPSADLGCGRGYLPALILEARSRPERRRFMVSNGPLARRPWPGRRAATLKLVTGDLARTNPRRRDYPAGRTPLPAPRTRMTPP